MNNCNSSLPFQPPSPFKNYVMGDKIFLLDCLDTDNTASLIGDLTTCINDPAMFGKEISFYINSPGGEVSVMKSILALMNMARLFNITVKTFVLGMAYSAASIIAVYGDERYMTKYAQHLVHFGMVPSFATKYSEIEKIMSQTKEHAEQLNNIYTEFTDLTPEKLEELQNDERGYLNAEECLKYNMCDGIIENELVEKNEFNNAYNKFNNEWKAKGYYKTEDEIKAELKNKNKKIIKKTKKTIKKK